ncbi:hypothetical protein AVEN_163506-1 [Araneus ventricosus]|uniref:Uncharacterized protein n=1 Tax=Araneus ventricosus TaxID=182803 RepID=A0A4Y2BPQ2_ARAVE|nr:hypothetical protein AVEN_163506-1 [Araneus ventricosus]
MTGNGSLRVRSRHEDWRIPGSKSDSTSVYVGPVQAKSDVENQMFSHWWGIESWTQKCRPRHPATAQNQEAISKIIIVDVITGFQINGSLLQQNNRKS